LLQFMGVKRHFAASYRYESNRSVHDPWAWVQHDEPPIWPRSDDDFDMLAEGVVVGRVFKANAAPVGSAWRWTLAFGHHEDHTPTVTRPRARPP
jgi:hypothetical protein